MIKSIEYIQALMDAGVELDCEGNPNTDERLELARQNAREWVVDPRRIELRLSTERQIKLNATSTKTALWYLMSDTFAMEQMEKRRKKP